MKKLCFIIFLMLMLMSGFSQNIFLDKTISISFENTTLKDALKQLENEADISFAYDSSPVFQNKVNVKFTNESVKLILYNLLKHKELGYKIIGDKIIIYKTKNRKNKVSISELQKQEEDLLIAEYMIKLIYSKNH